MSRYPLFLASLIALAMLWFSAGCQTLRDLERSPAYNLCALPNDNSKSVQCGGPYSDEEFQTYLSAFEEEWLATKSLPQNPEKLRKALRSIDLHWQHGSFSRPNKEGSPSLWGLTYPISAGGTRQAMICTIQRRIEDSSLGHELIHVSYGAITGNMVPDHFDNRIRWPGYLEDFLDGVKLRYRKKLNEQAESLRVQR